MPAYIPITDEETDPLSPLTSELGKKWRDNPLAVFEGAVGSPYMETSWHPFNSLAVGDGNTGRIWSFATHGAVATVTSDNFVDGFEYAFLFDQVRTSAGVASDLNINAWREASGGYAGAGAVGVNLSSTVTAAGMLVCHNPRQVQFRHFFQSHLWNSSTGNAVQNASTDLTFWSAVSHATAQKLLRVQFSSGANFNAGAIFQLRRRVYY